MPPTLPPPIQNQISMDEGDAVMLGDNASTVMDDGMDLMVDAMLYADLDMDVAL